MNSQQYENLKRLIAKTGLMTVLEKQEWRDFLEVMNDKQALELQHILESEVVKPEVKTPALETKPTPPKESIAPRPEAKPFSPPVAETEKPYRPFQPIMPAAKPSLDKIMHPDAVQSNVPAASGAVTPGQLLHNIQLKSLEHDFKPPVKPAAKPQISPPQNLPPEIAKAAQVQGVGFLQKLKSVLKKPELPAAHSEFQLELSEPKPELPAKPKTSPPAVPLAPSALKKSLVDTSQAKPVFKPEAPPIKKVGLELPNMPAGRSWKGAVSQSHLNPPPPKPLQKPGAPEKISAEPASEQAVASPEIRPIVSTPTARVPTELNLKTPQDVALLSPAHLSPAAVQDLASKIKHLVSKYGYFSVMENLEHSPAYQSYMFTGSKLLETGGGFNNLPASLEKYLSQEQFEVFADLLMEMQG
jgi:hypothetical protein